MTKLKTEIYTATTGVEMTLSWANEEEYQLGIKYMADMGAACGQSSAPEGDKPAYFCLENERQLDALLNFRRELRNRR
jgi:hypothetical protein